MSPEFKHDCKKCVFLGTLISEQTFDFYFCEQGSLGRAPTVVARFGDEEWAYKSGLAIANEDKDLKLAKLLAEQRGLIPQSST